MTEQEMILLCQSAQKTALESKREAERVTQECEEVIREAKALLVESKNAQEMAVKNFTIDDCGWVWRWNVEKKRYIKTSIHIGNNFKKDTDDILDGAVTTPKIADRAINEDKLDEDILNQIRSAGAHGYALSKNFGNSDVIGITQRKLTEEHEERMDAEAGLQNQINEIVASKAEVDLSATPSPVFVGIESAIDLLATTNTEASSIKIKKGDTELATGSGVSLYASDTITPSEAGNIEYTAEYTIAGLPRIANKNVVAVHPIRIGSGSYFTDGTPISTPKTSPAGTYNVLVAQNEDYVFFNVPATMTINRASISGFDFPLEEPQAVEIDGVEYKSYRSSNTYNQGTLTIVIS